MNCVTSSRKQWEEDCCNLLPALFSHGIAVVSQPRRIRTIAKWQSDRSAASRSAIALRPTAGVHGANTACSALCAAAARRCRTARVVRGTHTAAFRNREAIAIATAVEILEGSASAGVAGAASALPIYARLPGIAASAFAHDAPRRTARLIAGAAIARIDLTLIVKTSPTQSHCQVIRVGEIVAKVSQRQLENAGEFCQTRRTHTREERAVAGRLVGVAGSITIVMGVAARQEVCSHGEVRRLDRTARASASVWRRNHVAGMGHAVGAGIRAGNGILVLYAAGCTALGCRIVGAGRGRRVAARLPLWQRCSIAAAVGCCPCRFDSRAQQHGSRNADHCRFDGVAAGHCACHHAGNGIKQIFTVRTPTDLFRRERGVLLRLPLPETKPFHNVLLILAFVAARNSKPNLASRLLRSSPGFHTNRLCFCHPAQKPIGLLRDDHFFLQWTERPPRAFRC